MACGERVARSPSHGTALRVLGGALARRAKRGHSGEGALRQAWQAIAAVSAEPMTCLQRVISPKWRVSGRYCPVEGWM